MRGAEVGREDRRHETRVHLASAWGPKGGSTEVRERAGVGSGTVGFPGLPFPPQVRRALGTS